MVMAERQELLTVPDAAARLGISRSSLYVLVARGEIVMIPVIGRTRRVVARSLDDYIERRRAELDQG